MNYIHFVVNNYMTLKEKYEISRCKLIDFGVKTVKRFYGCIPGRSRREIKVRMWNRDGDRD